MANLLPSTDAHGGIVRHYSYPATTISFRDDVLRGLAAPQKTIPPKYFYDQRGSELFESICELPEYYPTRTEMAIMRENVDAMAKSLGPRCALIELGSGASLKTCILIERLAPLIYMPIDISASALHGATAALVRQFPSLNIASICGDFTRPLHLPDLSDFAVRRKIAYFPGSTIGNFTQDEASAFLRLIGLMVGKGGGLLIGVDTKKAKPILDAAYDDRQGVTAAFNLNLLTRINRELGADFHLDQFSHKAFYDEAKGRIEMHLESRCEQVVHVDGNTFALRAGETIHTENSCKYTVDEFRSMGREAGFKPVKVWIDQDRMFSVHAMTVV